MIEQTLYNETRSNIRPQAGHRSKALLAKAREQLPERS